MRPDPWQKEKSRKYQAKKGVKANSKGHKQRTAVETRQVNASNHVKREGGFKFINPKVSSQDTVSTPQDSQSEGEYEEEDAYDISGLDDLMAFQLDEANLDLMGGELIAPV